MSPEEDEVLEAKVKLSGLITAMVTSLFAFCYMKLFG